VSNAWKALERRKCRDLGGERRGQIGPGGTWSRGSDDSGTLPISLQVKRTKRYMLRRSWIEQARRDAKEDGRGWWVIAQDEHNDRYGGLATMPWPLAVELINWYFGEGRERVERFERLYAASGDEEQTLGAMRMLEEQGL
jgi:hypothetical protein